MSKSEILYVKGMSLSETECDDDAEEDIWDDKKLNDAYDKALRIANAEVARRVAMSTNTISKEDKTSKKSSNRPTSKGKKEVQWKVGMPCRALYEGDGLEYEAFVLRLINDKECIVRFLGYENSEIVLINTLKPTLGNEERTRQIEQAMSEKGDDGFMSQSPDPDVMDYGSDRHQSPGSTERSFQRKKKPSKKKKQPNTRNAGGFELPELPPMPNMSMLRNLGSMEMPIPPPPPMNLSPGGRSDSEDQAISSMLLSWYMSGYYTGLYQGMRRAKEDRRNN